MSDPIVMTPEQLNRTIGKAISESGTLRTLHDSVEEIKKLSAIQNQKRLLPDGMNAGGENETFAGTVADFSSVKGLAGNNVNASSLLSGSGIFKRVSPAMELFAGYLAHRIKCMAYGTQEPFAQLRELQEANRRQYKSYFKADEGAGSGMTEITAAGTPSAGSFLVPTEFPAIMIEIAAQISGIANACWRVPMTTNEMYLPRLDIDATTDNNGSLNVVGGGATLDNAAQAAATSRQGLSTSKVHIKAGRLSNMIVLANELINDAPINILNFVSAWMVRKYAYVLQGRS